MRKRSSSVSELIDLIELTEVQKILDAKNKKPEPKKWWNLTPAQMIRLYIILVLLYPFIGKAYTALLFAIWK